MVVVDKGLLMEMEMDTQPERVIQDLPIVQPEVMAVADVVSNYMQMQIVVAVEAEVITVEEQVDILDHQDVMEEQEVRHI